MAILLWKQVALPSILYGTECIPITKAVEEKITKTQNIIGKFALQVSPSSANLQVLVDAGLIPISFIICQRVLTYAKQLIEFRRPTLANKCLRMSMESNDWYWQYVYAQVQLLPTSPNMPHHTVKSIHMAVRYYIADRLPNFVSCFVMSPPDLQSVGKMKNWLCDSEQSKTYAMFRSMSCGLGNRFPTRDGFSSEICMLCSDSGTLYLNNEVHLLVECSYFNQVCDSGALGSIIQDIRQSHDHPSSVLIYRLLLCDSQAYQKEVRKELVRLLSAWKRAIHTFISHN